MRAPYRVGCLLAIGANVLGAGIASGQSFPAKPIRVVTAEVGGGNDFAARIVAQGLRDRKSVV